jgi:hypothetical protein
MPDKLYRVLAEYRDPRLPSYGGPEEGFTEAANRAETLRAGPDRASLRGVYIERVADHVIVWNASP